MAAVAHKWQPLGPPEQDNFKDWSEADREDEFIATQEDRLAKVQDEFLKDMLAHIDAAAGLLRVVTETLPQSSIGHLYRRQVKTLMAIQHETQSIRFSMIKG